MNNDSSAMNSGSDDGEGAAGARYHGHKTMTDGTHVPLTFEEARAMWESIERKEAATAEKLPTEQSCIDAICEAYHRLQKLGWQDPIYCPKDGSTFKVIEAGSTGIFDCVYEGKWPDGHWISFDEHDAYPCRPVAFKLYPEAQAKLDAAMAGLRDAFFATGGVGPLATPAVTSADKPETEPRG